jgi:hypothetical protein
VGVLTAGFLAPRLAVDFARQDAGRGERLVKISFEIGRSKDAAPQTSADDLLFKEWAECRATIARLDTILVDLRKVGFSFITALLTASSFLSLVDPKSAAAPTPMRAAAFIAIMVLIALLFAVDSYYQILLSGAVERALDLEVKTHPPLRLSKYLSINIQHTWATVVTLVLYLALLVTAGVLGLLGVNIISISKGDPALPTAYGLGPWNEWSIVIAILGAVLFLLILGYWFFIAWKIGFHRHRATRVWPAGERTEDKLAIT